MEFSLIIDHRHKTIKWEEKPISEHCQLTKPFVRINETEGYYFTSPKWVYGLYNCTPKLNILII